MVIVLISLGWLLLVRRLIEKFHFWIIEHFWCIVFGFSPICREFAQRLVTFAIARCSKPIRFQHFENSYFLFLKALRIDTSSVPTFFKHKWLRCSSHFFLIFSTDTKILWQESKVVTLQQLIWVLVIQIVGREILHLFPSFISRFRHVRGSNFDDLSSWSISWLW